LKDITTGILLQGDIRGWTIPIIEEYQANFPDSEIVFSTWENEDVSKIPCKVIQSKIPEETHPYKSTKNYQIIGCRNGLEEMKSDIILKTRSDVFVHNPNIFKIFLAENFKEKIMYPSLELIKESRDYWINDYCQVSSKETLQNYWDLMPLHDGRNNLTVEGYLTRNYVLQIKNDYSPWKIAHDKYFIKKRYHEDFQIEFEKVVMNEYYQDDLVRGCAENSTEEIIYPTK
jgi:hypothetical protein